MQAISILAGSTSTGAESAVHLTQQPDGLRQPQASQFYPAQLRQQHVQQLALGIAASIQQPAPAAQMYQTQPAVTTLVTPLMAGVPVQPPASAHHLPLHATSTINRPLYFQQLQAPAGPPHNTSTIHFVTITSASQQPQQVMGSVGSKQSSDSWCYSHPFSATNSAAEGPKRGPRNVQAVDSASRRARSSSIATSINFPPCTYSNTTATTTTTTTAS